jgi:hypothetical protein
LGFNSGVYLALWTVAQKSYNDTAFNYSFNMDEVHDKHGQIISPGDHVFTKIRGGRHEGEVPTSSISKAIQHPRCANGIIKRLKRSSGQRKKLNRRE